MMACPFIYVVIVNGENLKNIDNFCMIFSFFPLKTNDKKRDTFASL